MFNVDEKPSRRNSIINKYNDTIKQYIKLTQIINNDN